MRKNYCQSRPGREADGETTVKEQSGVDGGRIPFLGVFDGPTGAGKSAVFEHLQAAHGGSCVVGAKLTTRPRRPNDRDWELRFVETIPRSLRDFTYSSVGWQYAVDVAAVEEALEAGLSYFTICTNPRVTRTLARRFPTVVVYVHRLLVPREVSSLLADRRTTGTEEARLRRAEVAGAVARYAENIGLYDYVVLNVGAISELHRQVDAVLADCASRMAAPETMNRARDALAGGNE